MNKTKSIFRSKSALAASLTTIAAVVSLLLQQQWAVDNDTITKTLTAILGIISVGLRFVTDTAVTMMGGETPRQRPPSRKP